MRKLELAPHQLCARHEVIITRQAAEDFNALVDMGALEHLTGNMDSVLATILGIALEERLRRAHKNLEGEV